MFVDPGAVLLGIQLAKLEQDADRRMRDMLTPEAYRIWKAEKLMERRHQELCKAIRDAGKAARPRGLGIFW